MKKHIVIIALIVLFSVTSTVNNVQKVYASNEKAIKSKEIVRPLYTLGDYHGKISLYNYGEETPITVYDVFTSALPPADAEKLRKGITLNTQDELSKALEEYLS